LPSELPQFCPVSPREAHSQRHMTGITSYRRDSRKEISHMERDPGTWAAVHLCRISTHQVFVSLFSPYRLVHCRNGEQSQLCPELGCRDKGLIQALQQCCDRSNRMLF
jgi:hypothetical protein